MPLSLPGGFDAATQPPQVGTPLAASAIGRSLVFATDAAVSNKPYDVVSRQFGAYVGNCSAVGNRWTTTDLVSGIQFPHTPHIEQITTKLTFVVWAALTNAANYARLIEQPYNTSGAGTAPFVSWFFGRNASNAPGAAAYGAGVTFTEADSSASPIYYAATTQITQYAATMDLVAGTVNFYLGGALHTGGVSITPGVFDQGQKAPLNLFVDAGVGGASPNAGTQGSLWRAYVFSSVLSGGQIAHLNDNPYLIWQAPRRFWRVGLPASGVTRALAGTATADLTGTGSPTVTIRLAGIATLDYTATGGPTLTLPLVGTAALSVTATGQPKANANLSGTGSVDLSGLGTPVVTLRLAGQGSADITGGGALTVAGGGTTQNLAGVAIVNLTGQGGTTVAIPLNGTAAVSISGSGGPQQTVRLSGRASVDVTATATLGPLTPFGPTHSTTYGVQPLSADSYGAVSTGGTYGVALEPETSGGISGGQAFGAVAFTSQGDRA